MRKADEDIAAMAPCELDFLMARYNMAHAKAEGVSFLAEARDVLVVVYHHAMEFAAARIPAVGPGDPPTTAECMAWAAGHEATQVVLNSLVQSHDQLSGWVEGLASLGVEGMDQDARETWREYGELVYEESAAFETLY